jgi:hypothetical protein
MNYLNAICAVVVGVVVSVPSQVWPVDPSVKQAEAGHCIVALPKGIACIPVINEEACTITCTFPGLSVVQLREHCLSHVSCNVLSSKVCMAKEGAALELDVASFINPVVTIMTCPLSNHVVIGVSERTPPCFVGSSSLGTIVHSI